MSDYQTIDMRGVPFNVYIFQYEDDYMELTITSNEGTSKESALFVKLNGNQISIMEQPAKAVG